MKLVSSVLFCLVFFSSTAFSAGSISNDELKNYIGSSDAPVVLKDDSARALFEGDKSQSIVINPPKGMVSLSSRTMKLIGSLACISYYQPSGTKYKCYMQKKHQSRVCNTNDIGTEVGGAHPGDTYTDIGTGAGGAFPGDIDAKAAE